MLQKSPWWLSMKKDGVCEILKFEMKMSLMWVSKWSEIKWKRLHELSSFISETYEEIDIPTVLKKAFILKSLYVVNSQIMFASILKHSNGRLEGSKFVAPATQTSSSFALNYLNIPDAMHNVPLTLGRAFNNSFHYT